MLVISVIPSNTSMTTEFSNLFPVQAAVSVVPTTPVSLSKLQMPLPSQVSALKIKVISG